MLADFWNYAKTNISEHNHCYDFEVVCVCVVEPHATGSIELSAGRPELSGRCADGRMMFPGSVHLGDWGSIWRLHSANGQCWGRLGVVGLENQVLGTHPICTAVRRASVLKEELGSVAKIP